MVIEEFVSFFDWLLPGVEGIGFLAAFIVSLLVLTVIGVFVGFVVSAARHGPGEAFYVVAKTVGGGYLDLIQTSPRRLLAMARLAIQESLRRRVLVAFAVFVLVLLFAGWFLDVENEDPARLYLSFVLTAANYMVLLLALFLSTFSLPNDIKNRTIYTIVTKPVRAFEIVLGRIIGFTAVGTVLLAIMGVVSYFFVVRGLDHEHGVDAELTSVSEQTGETTFNAHHRHDFNLGDTSTETTHGHWHEIEQTGEGDAASYTIGPPRGMLQARVPVYGQLRFLNRSGQPTERGINVGHEWAYRSYIEGRTQAAAIWTFEGVTPERFPEGIPLEMNLRVFRSHKGDIESRIPGSIVVENPDPNKRIQSAPMVFVSQEFSTQSFFIPRKLDGVTAEGQIREIDLFEDLVEDGRVNIRIRCEEAGQYFGMAQADVYIRAANQYFWLNFAKGYAGIWLQMLMVTAFGVMFSTFLSGAVAMLATVASVVLGYFTQFVVDIATGSVQGGGPIESFIRIVTQKNVQVELDQNLGTSIIKLVDGATMFVMRAMTVMLPDYERFQTGAYVAYGFNIYGDLLAQHTVITLSYVFVVSIIGYFFLRTREIAA